MSKANDCTRSGMYDTIIVVVSIANDVNVVVWFYITVIVILLNYIDRSRLNTSNTKWAPSATHKQ